MTDEQPTTATDVSPERGFFDDFSDRASTVAAKPWFFLGIVVSALAWLALGPLTGFSHGWVDALQVVAALVTLLLVALLENEQWRNGKATQRKLNMLLEAFAYILERDEAPAEQIRQLQAAVGLEKRESISD
ncbi:MAG: low affinity iron permease family protein [Actinomycetota bacterium]|nr:low affinity iron permease family protein [Actinomycetota bacterium]